MNKKIAAGVATTVTALGLLVARPSGPGWYETAATQAIRYEGVPITADGWGPAYVNLDVLMSNMSTRLGRTAHRGEGYVIRRAETMEWSERRDLHGTIVRLHELLADSQDAIFIVRALKDDYRERAHTIDVNPTAMADTQGTQAVDIIVGTMAQHYPSLQVWGIYNCRRVAGSSSFSQHAWANAVDFGASYDYMDRAAHYMVEITRQGWLPASQILWDYSNLLSGNYVYDHTNHIHVSGEPLRTGWPPCA